MHRRILERIEAATAPVAVVDVEIRRYGVEDKIAALTRKLNLPLVTTFMGRGLLEHAPDVVARVDQREARAAFEVHEEHRGYVRATRSHCLWHDAVLALQA